MHNTHLRTIHSQRLTTKPSSNLLVATTSPFDGIVISLHPSASSDTFYPLSRSGILEMEYVEDLDCDSDSSDAVNETLEHYARLALADFDDDDLYSTKRDRKKEMSDHQHDNFEMVTDKVWGDLEHVPKGRPHHYRASSFPRQAKEKCLRVSHQQGSLFDQGFVINFISRFWEGILEQRGQQQRRYELKQKGVKQRELGEELEQKVTRQKKATSRSKRVLESRKTERKPQLDLERPAE